MYYPYNLKKFYHAMPGISASLSTTEMLFYFNFAEANHRTTRSDSLLLVRLIRCSYLLCPILFNLLMWLSLITDRSKSFYLERKLPALSIPDFDGNRGIICERKSKLSLNIVFSKRNKDLND